MFNLVVCSLFKLFRIYQNIYLCIVKTFAQLRNYLFMKNLLLKVYQHENAELCNGIIMLKLCTKSFQKNKSVIAK